MKRGVILSALLFSSMSAYAVEKPDRGWHWYDLPPEVIERIEQEIDRKVEQKVKEALKDKEPPAGSSAWIKQNIPKFRNMAADNPTAENIRALMYLERILFDRATTLGKRSKMIAQSDPLLESGHSSTASLPQARARRAAANQRRDDLVTDLTAIDKVVLWVFVDKASVTNDIFIETLGLLTREHDIPVLFILMDGAEPPKNPLEENSHLWEHVVDSGQSKLFPLLSFPTTYAYHSQKNDYVLLSQGHMPVSGFKDRLITAADYAGWISPEQVQATRFNPSLIDFNAIDFESVPEGLSNPKNFLNYVQQKINRELIGE